MQELCESQQRKASSMNAITIGKTRRPGESSIDGRAVELPLGDPHGVTLMPGQSVWRLEWSLCALVFPVFWPALITNEGGQARKYILGIDDFQAAVR